MHNIKVLLADITKAEVDAIVNAANPQLLGGGGVDGAIHRAAGPALLAACKAIPANQGVRCPPGEARITTAGKLEARHVIHTVGPIYQRDPTPAQTLARAYRNSLQLATENACSSIAFPAISCGVYGYPHQAAAEIAIAECRASEFTDLAIEFYLFSEALYQIWLAAVDRDGPPAGR